MHQHYSWFYKNINQTHKNIKNDKISNNAFSEFLYIKDIIYDQINDVG